MEVDGAAVLVQRGLQLVQPLGGHAVPALGVDVGGLDVAEGKVDGGQVAVSRLEAALGDFGGRLGFGGRGVHGLCGRFGRGGFGSLLGGFSVVALGLLVRVYPLEHLRLRLGIELGEDRLDVLLVNLLPVLDDIRQLGLELVVVTVLPGLVHELLPQEAVGVGREQAVRRYEVLVPPRVAGLVAAEGIVGALDAPDADLLRERGVDLLDDVLVLDNELQADDVACGVHALVGSRAAHEARLLVVVGVGLGDGAGGDEGLEQVALDRLLLVVDLHALVARAGVPDHDGDLALRAAGLGGDLLGGEGVGGLLGLAVLVHLAALELLVLGVASALVGGLATAPAYSSARHGQ